MRDQVRHGVRAKMYEACQDTARALAIQKPWEDGDVAGAEVSIPADVWAVGYDGVAPPTDLALRVRVVYKYHVGKKTWEFQYWQAGFMVPSRKCTHCRDGWRDGRPCDICGCTGWLGPRDTWQPWTEENYFEWGSGPVVWIKR